MSALTAPLTPKQQEIADAALRIIGSQGVAALTMAVLAQELGVSTGAPFRHFASRDEILEAVVRRVEELVSSSFPDPALPPMARLEHLFLTRAATVGKHAGIARLVFSEQFVLALPAAAAERLRGLVKRTRGTILEALKEAAKNGTLRADLPPEELLPIVIGALQHLVFLGAMGPALPQPPGARKVFAVLLRLLTPPPENPTEKA